MRHNQKRRRVARARILLFCLALMVLLAGGARGQAPTGLTAIRVASGLSQPLFVTAPPGDFDHLFIVQQTGKVVILNLEFGTIDPTAFIDVSAKGPPAFQGGGEQGLLGLAFDPNYGTSGNAGQGKFYLNFIVASQPGDDFPNGVTHVSQFTASGDPLSSEKSSSRSLIRKPTTTAAGSDSVRAQTMQIIFTLPPATVETGTIRARATLSPAAMRRT